MIALRTALLALFCIATLTACTESVGPNTTARVMVMGDSLMAFNRIGGNSVADALEMQMGEEVIDRAASGAAMLTEGDKGIPAQFASGPWDWVVLNGYGNDLLFGCGCSACDGRMDRLIAGDGADGAIPELVAQLRAEGLRVIYTGYMRTPGFASPVEGCVALGDEMDRRLSAMAAGDEGVHFVSLDGLVPDGDRSFHGPDRIHPSPKGSRAIAQRVHAVIRQVEGRL